MEAQLNPALIINTAFSQVSADESDNQDDHLVETMLTGKDGDQLSISAVDFSSGHSSTIPPITHLQCSAMPWMHILQSCMGVCTIVQ